MTKFTTSLLATAFSLTAANGATVTYVDAVVSGMSGTVNTTGPSGPTASATAWQIRGTNGGNDTSSFANEGSALQYITNPINAANPTLTTTVSGLDPSATYRAYVFFWTSNLESGGAFVENTAGNAWDVNAKLSTDASYTTYAGTPADSDFLVSTDAGTVGGATVTGYNTLTLTDLVGENVLGQGADDFTDAYDGNRGLVAGALPTLITGVTEFSVDIQASAFNNQRSWYDGIGYEVIPEPSVSLLGGLALLALLRRKR